MKYDDVLEKVNELNLVLQKVANDYFDGKYSEEEQNDFKVLIVDMIIHYLVFYFYLGGDPILLNIRSSQTEQLGDDVKLVVLSFIGSTKVSSDIYRRIKTMLEKDFGAKTESGSNSSFANQLINEKSGDNK